MTRTIVWVSLVLAVCITQPALAKRHDYGTVEEQATRLLMNKDEMLDGIREVQSRYLYYAGKTGVTRKDRECFRNLAAILDQQIFEFRLATDDVTYQQFVELAEEDPDEAHEWGEELIDLRESVAGVIQSTWNRHQDECMSFED